MPARYNQLRADEYSGPRNHLERRRRRPTSPLRIESHGWFVLSECRFRLRSNPFGAEFERRPLWSTGARRAGDEGSQYYCGPERTRRGYDALLDSTPQFHWFVLHVCAEITGHTNGNGRKKTGVQQFGL